MSEQPLVSICVPVYNGSNFLRESLDNLLAQTYTNLQIIISDNASTDKTPDICRQYAKLDSRIQYEPNTVNIGSIPNFNRALSFARGKYVRIAAHDDLCSLDSVEKSVETLENDTSIVMAHAEDNMIDDHGQPLPMTELRVLDAVQPTAGERFRHYMDVIWFQPWHYRIVHPVFGIMRTEVIKARNGMGEGFGDDLIMLGEFCLRGKVVQVKGITFSRRIHQHQMETRLGQADLYSLAVGMNPKAEGKWLLHRHTWKRFNEMVSGVPLSQTDRAVVNQEMQRWLLRYAAPAMARNVRDFIKRQLKSS